MDTNKMREQFEEYARSKNIDASMVIMYACYPPRFARYADRDVQEKWELWQASRESVVVELPSLREVIMGRRENEYDSGTNNGIELCREALEAQGLKVAP